jgi:OmcA/MtrC family decaheme c-type cytochrome
LKPGTYTVFVEVTHSKPLGGWQFVNFQVGTETAEKKVATNCTDCHGDNRQHPEFFAVKYDTDICKNCHDNERLSQIVGWNVPGGWNGYGAQPLVRKVHGVHFGRYLNNPEDIVFPALRKTFNFSEVIFPQDVRNCTKCHDPKGSPAWKENPSRLACMACHDSASANGHAKLMTVYPNPADPWSSDRVETCKVCHGAGKEFSPDKVHNISNPYKPPYPREPENK